MDISIEKRRVACGESFRSAGFHRTHERNPADEYTNSSSGSIVYFYWKQGGGKDITVGIDPSIDFKPLLEISGVRLRATGYPDGLRSGTAMRSFPKTFGEVIPDKKSKVGRFFGIDLQSSDGRHNDQYLNAFLKHLSGQVATEKALPASVELNTSSSSKLTGITPPSSESLSADEQERLQRDTGVLETSEREAVVKVRYGQGKFREALIDEDCAKCWMSGIEGKQLLIASHIKPWSACEDDTGSRGNPNNGLLLSSLWDAAFDSGLITFGNDWQVFSSTELSETARDALKIKENISLPERYRNNVRGEYLTYHRNNVFERWKKSVASV